MEYVLGPKTRGSCIFCFDGSEEAAALAERLVVARRARSIVMLNRYPFASGHLMILPKRHVSFIDELDEEEHGELWSVVRASVQRLRKAVGCEGLNVGLNLGAAAGAGIAEHLHVHIVPRWAGDTNFMPVLADARVVPQALDETRAHLAPLFADLEEA
jgi:ATP adenylyltransferase